MLPNCFSLGLPFKSFVDLTLTKNLIPERYLGGQIPSQKPPLTVPHCPAANIRPHLLQKPNVIFLLLSKIPKYRFEHRGSCSAKNVFCCLISNENLNPEIALMLSNMFKKQKNSTGSQSQQHLSVLIVPSDTCLWRHCVWPLSLKAIIADTGVTGTCKC